jgi:hypothetical protein
MASSSITTGTIGFPRIGPNREMKKALERSASATSFKSPAHLLVVDLVHAAALGHA